MRIRVGLVLLATFAPLQFGQLKLPPYTETKLPNGVTIAMMPRTGVPLVHFRIMVRGGSEGDPAQLAGLSSVTEQLLRAGTAKRTSDQFSEELDFLGGTFGGGGGGRGGGGGGGGALSPSTAFSAEFLSKDFDRGLDLLSDAVLNPTFPEDKVRTEIARRVDSARAAKDNAQGALRSYFQASFFGKEHPYGNPPDEASLGRITRKDIVDYYHTVYCGKNVIIVVTGDFDPAAAKAKLTKTFGSLPAGNEYAWKTAAPPLRRGRMILIDKPDATQTYFIIAQPGIDRKSPDRAKLVLINTLFGGRFTSMLNMELRANSGLTYGANSSVEEPRLQGAILISTYTKTETTVQAIDLALEQLKRLNEKGITAAQLTSARAYVKGLYPTRQLETIDQLANALGEIELWGDGRDEFDGYFSRLDAVTVDSANAAIKKYYRTDNLTFVLLGAADKIRDSVKKYDPHFTELSAKDAGWGER
jgi:predicted Zn-dependent peptidase